MLIRTSKKLWRYANEHYDNLTELSGVGGTIVCKHLTHQLSPFTPFHLSMIVSGCECPMEGIPQRISTPGHVGSHWVCYFQ